MKGALIGTNIIVLASHHNPSIATKDWLLTKRIIEESVTNFAHTPTFSLTETETIIMAVDESRLTVSLKVISEPNLAILPQIVLKYMENLPETPYIAKGYNFSWKVSMGEENRKDELTSLFPKGEDIIKGLSDDNWYEIGGILLLHWQGFQTKVVIDPFLGSEKDLTVDFNYHLSKNLFGDNIKYLECFKHSKEIIKKLFKKIEI